MDFGARKYLAVAGACLDVQRDFHKGVTENLDAFNGQESCAVCHGQGRDLAIEAVHQL